MSAPDKPNWAAVAEALEHLWIPTQPLKQEKFLSELFRAARWALQHGPAIEGAETVWWCRRHSSNGSTHPESAGVCWFIMFAYRGRDVDLDDPPDHLPCRMVPKRLLPQIGEGE